ncbi:MAG: 8-oxo-dGTP diphosphatase [Clostridia bacterium]|nr:8-oxo-dGTP diphosphatase [Clostridia bacterium]
MQELDKLETTLLLLKRDDEILLAMKKRGFGIGKYNGIGGKIEKGETPEEAMIREAQEEVLVTPTKYDKVGVVEFIEFYKGKKQNVIFHLFVATNWEGEPQESEEMNPKWFKINEIPYNQMFEDDRYWLPIILQGKKIKAFFEFDENWKLLYHSIKEVNF